MNLEHSRVRSVHLEIACQLQTQTYTIQSSKSKKEYSVNFSSVASYQSPTNLVAKVNSQNNLKVSDQKSVHYAMLGLLMFST